MGSHELGKQMSHVIVLSIQLQFNVQIHPPRLCGTPSRIFITRIWRSDFKTIVIPFYFQMRADIFTVQVRQLFNLPDDVHFLTIDRDFRIWFKFQVT